jgi:hypothetical protein
MEPANKSSEPVNYKFQSYRLVRCFIYSSAFSLLITAGSKLISAAGSAAILDSFDVLFPLRTRLLLRLTGGVECMIAFLLLSQVPERVKAFLLSWLALCFMVYKIGRFVIHAPLPCPCLGSVSESIGLTVRTATNITDGLIIYYLAGTVAYFALRQTKA